MVTESQESRGVVLTVENRKGGVGKTTTAITLAVGLAQLLEEQNKRVLIIDMDPQGDAARGLGIKPSGQCVSKVLEGAGDVEDLRANVLPAWTEDITYRPNLFVLPASDRLSGVKEDMLTEFALLAARNMRSVRGGTNQRHLVNVLDERLALARQAFAYIIIDCPPTLDMLQQAIHQFADAAIVPVKVDYHGASATGRHTGNILDDQADGINIKVAAIVPTFYNARLRLTQHMMKQLINTYGEQVVTLPIPNTIRVAESPARGGLTILEYEPNSPASSAYWELIYRIYKDYPA